MKIAIFDTSIESLNVGDKIIMESVRNVMNELFSDFMEISIPTQSSISSLAHRGINNSKYGFIGGTNLLSSHMLVKRQWKLNLYNALNIGDLILLGVGWWQYQNKPDFYTKFMLRQVLNRQLLHSVRDNHTKSRLESIGIKNVINTSCPTMWQLNECHCEEIPTEKSENVVFTLTDYNKNPELDNRIIQILSKNYSKVYFWPQGSSDLDYINRIGSFANLSILEEGLKSFDRILANNNISLDYVGTRLHGGVRALQFKRRAIIIGIDNRATEKSKDFNLLVIDRADINGLRQKIKEKFKTEIKLPINSIETWKNQFK